MRVPSGEAQPRRASWGMVESFIGLILAVFFMLLLIRWITSGTYIDGDLALVLSYAVVWLPLLGACAWACFMRGSGSLARDLGLRLTWLDLLFGLGVGLLARVAASILEITFYGRLASLGVSFGDVVYDGWWVFGTILAPVLLAPVVEELFFRGLVQRATFAATAARASRRAATAISVLVSASLFALLHLTEVANPTAAIVLGVSTFVFGLGAAGIAASTGRIGGSIIAHVTFNGSLVLAALTM